MAKKPTGIIGAVGAIQGANGVSRVHNKIEWPEDPLLIQDMVCEFFLNEWRKVGVEIKKQSGGTHDLDYLLTLPNGEKVWLELMEAVFPFNDTNPFQPKMQSHSPRSYADTLYKEIEKKTKRYGFNHMQPIDLLIYVTHEQYCPNESACLILTKYLQERKHSFRYVFFLVPEAHDRILLRDLLNPDRIVTIPPIEELEKNVWSILPVANMKLYNKNGEIV